MISPDDLEAALGKTGANANEARRLRQMRQHLTHLIDAVAFALGIPKFCSRSLEDHRGFVFAEALRHQPDNVSL